MQSVILILGTFILDYLIYAVLVGLSFALVLLKNQRKIAFITAFPILFSVFAFIDLFSVPALHVLDISFTVGNQKITELFKISPNYKLSDLVSLGFFDLIVWSLQTIIAILIGNRVLKSREF